MYVVHHSHLESRRGAGERRRAVADRRLGVQAFAIWTHRLEPGARSPQALHHGELAVLVLAGRGKLLVDGGPVRFAAPCTLLPPPHLPFRVCNDGTETLQLVTVCTPEPCGSCTATPAHGPSPQEPLAPSGDAEAAGSGNTAGHAENPRHEPQPSNPTQGA
jgi:mannose-6-phosphate isomerase-like protein (cupin superfamily)